MLRSFASSLVVSCAVALAACSGGAGEGAENVGSTLAATASASGPALVGEFETPSTAGEQPVIDAINESKSSIRMIMFHLTNPAVVTALVAAEKRGVDVELILDNGNLTSHTPASITEPLKAAGVKIIPSSTGFRITHVKSLVVDEEKAIIMSLNLTMDFATTRDYAVVTTDAGVIAEFLKVFSADVVNARNGTASTPSLTSPYLAWSPVNSEGRLTAFVNSAQKTLVATSENLGDPDIQNAMIAAVKRGVQVRIISPLCDQNVDALYDLPFLDALAAGGVEARAMPSPASAVTPYMHAKMMVADGTSAFIGSVNFSTASTTDARELGIFFTNAAAIKMISQAFEEDWNRSVVPPPAASVNCSVVTTADGGSSAEDGGAPAEDASAKAADSGSTKADAAPTADAGAPTEDAANTKPDVGVPTEDAGVKTDAATEKDSGAATADAGVMADASAGKEDAGSTDDAASTDDSGLECTGYASPTTVDSCTGCDGESCQPNGCYGGYWCDDANGKCVSPSKVPCASK